MNNSRIAQKVGRCSDCQDGSEKPLIAGRCQYHWKLYRYNKNRDRDLVRGLVTEQTQVEAEDYLWFRERRKEMTGRCLFCGGRTEKTSDKTFKRSIAHLLAKRPEMFPSVRNHPDNWLELCHYGNSCHANFDNAMIPWELLRDSKRWGVISEKFMKVYPFIAEREKKNIPEILLKTIIPSP